MNIEFDARIDRYVSRGFLLIKIIGQGVFVSGVVIKLGEQLDKRFRRHYIDENSGRIVFNYSAKILDVSYRKVIIINNIPAIHFYEDCYRIMTLLRLVVAFTCVECGDMWKPIGMRCVQCKCIDQNCDLASSFNFLMEEIFGTN